MGVFEQFPYTNFHELNQDWIIRIVKELSVKWSEFQAYVLDYIKNLDIDEEIKEAIIVHVNQMIADGEINAMITQAIASEIPDSSAPVFVSSTRAMTDQEKVYVLTTTGHIYAFNGSTFYDTGLVYNVDSSTWYSNNGVLTTGTDLDSLVDGNGYWFLSSSSEYGHMPTNVTAGLLLSTKTGTVTTQILTGLSFNHLMRYKVGAGTWSEWIQTGIGNQGVLATGTDWNDITDAGYYLVSSTYQYTNLPAWANGIGGILVVYHSGSYVMQIFTRNIGQSSVRVLPASGTWTEWNALGAGNNGVLPNNSDLNDYIQDGYWFLNGSISANYSNMPIDVPTGSAAWLIIRRYNTVVTQMVIKYSDGLTALRSSNDTGSTWREWRTIAGKEADSGGLADKKYYAFGDSITWGSVWADGSISQANYDDRIPTRIGHACGVADTVNRAVGNIGYIAQVDGDTIQDIIEATDITDAALITLAGGRNDGSYQLTAIMDAIEDCIDYIKTQNKTCQIVILQPTPHSQTDGAVAFTETTTGGWSLDSFETAAKTLAAAKGCGYVGWRECSYVWNWASFTGDQGNYAHPNASWLYGQLGAYMGGKVSGFFRM